MAKLYVRKSDGTYVPQQSVLVSNLDIVQSKGDSLTSAMSQKAVTDELATKQDTIPDLETIRSNSQNASDAVTSMIEAGYVFAGIATPSTNPETPNAKIFYIANGKGTYTNFGGLEVTEGEVVVLYYDTDWHKEATGIASQEKLTELERKITDINGDDSIIFSQTLPQNETIVMPYVIHKGDTLHLSFSNVVAGNNIVVKLRSANNVDQALYDGQIPTGETSFEGDFIAVRDSVSVVVRSSAFACYATLTQSTAGQLPQMQNVIETLETEVGNLSELNTTEKDNLVDAINEVKNIAMGKNIIYDGVASAGTAQIIPCNINKGDSVTITFTTPSVSTTSYTIGLSENGNITQYFLKTSPASASIQTETFIAERNANQIKSYIDGHTGQYALKIEVQSSASVLEGVSIINACSYGAVDGGDIYNAFQSIFAKIHNKSAVIYLPQGTYTCSNALMWESHWSLIGDGVGRTIIKSTYNSAFRNDYGIDNVLNDVHFRDFTIDGSLVPSGTGKGFQLFYLKDATFRNLEIINTLESGLGCDMFINGVIDNVKCDNCGRGGDLSGNAFGCSGIGIGTGAFSRGNESLTISNCHCNNCKQNGIFIERQSGDNPVGTSIIGCTCEGNRNGFGVSGSDNVIFVACTAYNNHHAGFSYDMGTMHGNNQGTRPKFIGCVSKSNGRNIPAGYPLYDNEINGQGWFIKSNMKGCELIGCTSMDNLMHGIYAPDGAVELSIIGGTFANNGGDGMYLNKCSRFKIEPSFVQYNKGNGIHLLTSSNFGFIKDTIVMDNTLVGIKIEGTKYQTIISDYLASGNSGGDTEGV